MTKRDFLLIGSGVSIAVVGTVFTLLGFTSIGLIGLFSLLLLVLVVEILQRRQLALVQKRLLDLMRRRYSGVGTAASTLKRIELLLDDSYIEEKVHTSSKRIVGLIQSQQIQIDSLTSRLDRSLDEHCDDKK